MDSNKNYDDLYEACRTGDIDAVKRLVPLLSFEELHHRVEPVEILGMVPSLLAVAWSTKNIHIAGYLMDNGVMQKMTAKRLLSSDAQEQTSSHEDEQCVSIPLDTYRLRDRVSIDVVTEEPFEWLSGDVFFASFDRLRMSDRGVIAAAESIMTDPRFRDISNIQWYLKKACETENPEYLIKLYTLSGDFYKQLNQALAKDKNLGIGMKFDENFSGIYLYVGCLSGNRYLKKFRYSGRTYRGMRLNRTYFESNYSIHRRIRIRSFTSTSKSRNVAEIFADTSHSSEEVPVLCIFTIPEYTAIEHMGASENIALDISSISVIQDEDEVLILPHVSFEISKISHQPTGLIEVELKYVGF